MKLIEKNYLNKRLQITNETKKLIIDLNTLLENVEKTYIIWINLEMM